MMSACEEWELNFDSAPFCNGSLHLGHVRNYVLGDVRARWLRRRGVNVTYLSAYDAFGLPNEEGAREAGIRPDAYVALQASRISKQISALGLSYSRSPLPQYSDPSYYKWTQWLFLKLWEQGLIYQKEQSIPYCPTCDSFLANTQITDDGCWRCEGNIISRPSEQWFVRTTDYMDRLYEGIDSLSGWSDRARNILRSFMGRLEGSCSDLVISVAGRPFQLRLFSEKVSPYPGAIALRSDHPLALRIQSLENGSRSVYTATRRVRRTTDRSTKTPLVWISINARIVPVYLLLPGDIPTGIDALQIADTGGGTRTSGLLLRARVVNTRPEVVYRTQDWLVSRNRRWGTPLPAVECSICGTSPVDESDLPVRLPVHGGENHSRCSQCGTLQPCVSRVLDCFFDDSWCFYATVPGRSEAVNPFEAWKGHPPARVHFHAGYDTFVYLHVFRFIGHVLYDLGYSKSPEPITFYHGHDVITADGRKMSKRHRNAPDLDDLLERWGSDAIRLSVLVNANPRKTMSWSEDRLRHGKSLVATIRNLDRLTREQRQEIVRTKTPLSPGIIRRIEARLERVDRFIEEYRTGAALDQLYLATREVVSIARTNEGAGMLELCYEVLSWWQIFAPNSTEERIPEIANVSSGDPSA